MRVHTNPAPVTVAPDTQLADVVFADDRANGDIILFQRRTAGGWRPVTARQFAADVRSLAAGFLAAGIQPGDRVALLAATSYEWTLLDYALWTVAALPVPIYETSSAEQVRWVLEDAGPVAVVVEHDSHRRLVEDVAEGLSRPPRVWQIDGGGLDRLREDGRDVDDAQLRERRRAVSADDLATIIYTSGTTGRPKGCMLSHGNLLHEARVAIDSLEQIFGRHASTLLFLPLAHVFARVIQVACVERGVCLAHNADRARLTEDLAALRPSFLLAVPRVFERVHNTAQQRARAQGRGRIFDWAERTAVAYSQALDDGRPGWRLRLAHRLADRLVYRRLRAALGGRVRYAISGGAPLGTRLGHFFRGIGITVLEGYGLTETSAAATVNLPHALKIGTVGPPLPGVGVRIADDGEILVKGPIVFQGYWRNEQVTRQSLTADGWLRTGDVGALDENGFLTISGRKKEIIVTAGGKNLAPEPLEDHLRTHPLISQAVVVGDRRPYTAALITLDAGALTSWKRANGKPEQAGPADLRDDPDLLATLQAAVDAANTSVSRAESIRRFRILPGDLTEQNGYLTPTLKVKRALIHKDFAADIEELYR
ncbi:AMP-dependent synthetase/ligase [Nonomuraea gerenzanensis]|uniref:Long-chain fatty-acid-CoA ligase, Mycobacterial subgroup FadD15 n=1 Tax=Nonomuraea gerenzanensis TaxID=93944 RepID=A0A1M4EJA6_9ACTN|nr:long-chain fatty acid--CoA ligase [Nonomuraea gerenzanensis]UBU10568.1 long-chain fatty acid--CoA ligase [Nonomuraea gerenzanensis]SBO98979.1 Long-chain fatty-acid-CoA ligase, Mycobacterial subgroup FadD15 [Nonomuraea gerenzanensis]